MTDDKGYVCLCGAVHKYPGYVYAHWEDELIHTCTTCGRKNSLWAGVVVFDTNRVGVHQYDV